MEAAEGEVYRLRRVGKAASRPDVQDVFRLASTPQTLQIGRNPAQCDVFIDSQSHPALISRRHAEIHVQQDGQGNVAYHITDRSVNGTYVNDIRLKPQTPHRLQEGDTVTFGHLKAGTVQPGQLAVQAGSEFKFRFEKCVRPGDVDTRTDSETPTLSHLTAPGDAGRGNGRQLFPSVPSPDVLQDISNWVQKSKLVNTDAEKGGQKTGTASSSSTGHSQLSVPDDSDSEIFSIAATLQIPSDSDSDSDIFSHTDLKTPTSQDKSLLAKDSNSESPGAVSMATTVSMATGTARLSKSPIVTAGGVSGLKSSSSTVSNNKRKRKPNAGKPGVPAKRGRRVKSDRSGEEDWVICDSFDCSRPEGDMISWLTSSSSRRGRWSQVSSSLLKSTNSNTMESQTTNNNVADDFLSYHRSLGNHVLTTYVGGAGWLVDDISVSEKKFPPKTVLMKTSKCTELGSIVLEPLDNPNLNTTFRAKRTFKFTEPPASDVLDQVQTSRADHEVEKYDIVTMVMKVEGGGGVGVHHVGEVGVTYCKVKRSTVKVTCRGLREIAVDFQTLANNLASLSLREKLRNDDDSFLVMTHVLAAKELSWEKVKGEEERVRYGGKLKLLIGACLGDVSCDVCREKETPEKHLHAVRDAILAFKLAKVNVTDKVTIARDGVLKDGEFEGNYTLARGEVDRAGQYALRVTYRQDEPPRLSRDSLVFRLLGAGGTREDITVREEDLLTSGTYQTRFYRDSTGLFPLSGVRVWKKRPRTLMEWIRVKFTGTKDRSRLRLVKLT
ncbi:PREDICTED: uncharacterized protein LOC109487485 [Branchiostoma belcheri]|uniref:Uncharacterized protein LOC109487485 n=1 Tax=Branchiostoma belcheri TaxID=7741 RepID=A0A6P5AVB9_BRABE|nr:PREDICTED: uncharacterized protein LOC109487485 [Branchiostoma belcheri]